MPGMHHTIRPNFGGSSKAFAAKTSPAQRVAAAFGRALNYPYHIAAVCTAVALLIAGSTLWSAPDSTLRQDSALAGDAAELKQQSTDGVALKGALIHDVRIAADLSTKSDMKPIVLSQDERRRLLTIISRQ